jgi:hypothetical protein
MTAPSREGDYLAVVDEAQAERSKQDTAAKAR